MNNTNFLFKDFVTQRMWSNSGDVPIVWHKARLVKLNKQLEKLEKITEEEANKRAIKTYKYELKGYQTQESNKKRHAASCLLFDSELKKMEKALPGNDFLVDLRFDLDRIFGQKEFNYKCPKEIKGSVWKKEAIEDKKDQIVMQQDRIDREKKETKERQQIINYLGLVEK